MYILVDECEYCHGSIFWDTDEERFVFDRSTDCPCEVNEDKLPEWLREEIKNDSM